MGNCNSRACKSILLASVLCLGVPFQSKAEISSISTLPTSQSEYSPVLEEGMFTSGGTYELALKLYEEIQKSETGTFEIVVPTLADAWKVKQCLGYELLNGRSDISSCRVYSDGNERKLKWESGTETMREHQVASEFIDRIWEEQQEKINSHQSESEKVDYMSKIILNQYVTAYDRTYKNYAISDMVDRNVYKATCGVFSMVLDRLCEKANINSFIEVGYYKGSLHAWNKIVYSDGSISMVDLTVYLACKNEEYLHMKESSSFYKSRYKKLSYTSEGYMTGVPDMDGH